MDPSIHLQPTHTALDELSLWIGRAFAGRLESPGKLFEGGRDAAGFGIAQQGEVELKHVCLVWILRLLRLGLQQVLHFGAEQNLLVLFEHLLCLLPARGV